MVAVVLSCNFRFPSLHLVRGLSSNDCPGHESFQRLYLPFIYPGPALRVVLSSSTFRYAPRVCKYSLIGVLSAFTVSFSACRDVDIMHGLPCSSRTVLIA